MDEAEYCHRLALMYRGKVIALGTPAELKQSLRAHHLLRLEVVGHAGQHEGAGEAGRVSRTSRFSAEACTSPWPTSSARFRRSARRSKQAGIAVPVLEPIEPSMEDVFVAMIEAGREESRMSFRRLKSRHQKGAAAHRARCPAA